MRAALMLIPLAAFAAAIAAAAPDKESMDLGNDVVAMDMESIGNSTEAGPEPALIWLPNHIWLRAAEAESGAVWYFDPWESDFSVTPFRVVLAADETPDAASAHDDTLRLAEIDCAGHRYRILSTIHYDDAGNTSESDERGDGSLVPTAANSVFAAVEESVCRHAEQPDATDMNGM
jgi:hypothetical protein